MHRLISLLTLFCLCIATPAFAQYMLNFREADIRAVVQDISRVTGKTIVVDERVQSKISVVSERPLTRSEYFEVFLAALRANGLVAIPMTGGGFRIQPAANAASQPTRVGGSTRAAASQLVTEVFRLRHIEAGAAVETLRPLVSKEGSITANTNANSVVVVDYADNVRRINQLLKSIDRDTSATEIVQLKNAGAWDITTSLQTLAGVDTGGRIATVTVVAIEASNSIAIRGDEKSVREFAALARKLDTQADSKAEIKVYWLEHADADHLLPVLQNLVGQSASVQDTTPEFMNRSSSTLSSDTQGAAQTTSSAASLGTVSSAGTISASGNASNSNSIAGYGPAIVSRFNGGNAIIVAARPELQKQLGEIVHQLDTPRPQILVEAIVVELSNDAAKRLGVQFLLTNGSVPLLGTSYSNATPNLLTVASAYGAYELSEQTTTVDGNVVTTTQSSPLGNTLLEAAAEQLISANGGFGGAVINLTKNLAFSSILNAVQTDTEANLLSSPSIMVMDSQSARMLVGQEVPVTTGEALSNSFDNAFRTVERKNVGIQLEVKPVVNSAGQIKLFVRQEVSSIAGPVSSRNSELVFNKREFQTTLSISDGQLIVIGGLIDENERRTIERVPLLSDLPVIGDLFKSKSRAKGKTNLVVFIRPSIIRSRAEADALTARRYGYFRQGQADANPDAEPGLDNLLRDYMGVQPPIDAVQPGDDVYIIGDARRVNEQGNIVPYPSLEAVQPDVGAR